jgi:pyruvate dehydrogenase E2 component (dihydrolipoamide acetyltransferase)
MEVKLPKLGESAEGGSVVSILVQEGDTIAKGQTLLELENEKAVAPIPSPAAGVVGKIRIKEGDRVLVGQVLLEVEAAGGAAPAAAPAPAPAAAAPRPAARVPAATAAPVAASLAALPAPVSAAAFLEPVDGPMPPASPELRRIARLLGIDLRRVPGSEAGGRVVMADVAAWIQQLQALAAQPRFVAAPAAAAAPAAPVESIDFSKWGPVTKKPLTPLRRTISRRMVENWNAIPHVTQFDEADVTDLMELRKKFAPEYEKKGARLTLTTFALKAVVAALRKHPIFNASLDEAAGEVVFKDYHHVGLAVDTDQGLLVPVIREVDRKTLLELSVDVQALAEKARDRKVGLDEMKGGTFTISNQGGIGGGHFTPIVNKPEVAILGLGRSVLKPVVGKDGKVQARLMLPLAISYDHRLIDGGTAARFTVDLVAAFQGFTAADLKL